MAEAGHGVAVGAMVGTSIFGYEITRPITTISEGDFGSRAWAGTAREEGGLFDGREVGAPVCGFRWLGLRGDGFSVSREICRGLGKRPGRLYSRRGIPSRGRGRGVRISYIGDPP